MKRPYWIKSEVGMILIYRHPVSTRFRDIKTKIHVLNKKEFEIEYKKEIEFEIEKGKVVGFMKEKTGVIDGPGIILHSPFWYKFIFLFSDDTYIEKIEPAERSIRIENDTKAYLEFLGFENDEILFYLSVLEMGKARGVKVEIEWVYAYEEYNHIVGGTELLKEVSQPGTYKIGYKLLKEGNKNIYIFPSFYIPSDLNFWNISKNTIWDVYYKLSADVPSSPDECVRSLLN